MEDVGKACGMAGPAIYHYFASKEELFAETIRATGKKEVERLREACFANDDPRKRVTVYIEHTLCSMLGFMKETQLSDLAPIIPLACDAAESFNLAQLALLVEILDDGQHKGVFRQLDANHTAALLISFMRGLALDRVGKDKLLSPEEDAALLIDLWLHGICR